MTNRTRIKICGVRDAATATLAVEAGAQAVGVVLAEGSPRRISLEVALEIHHAISNRASVIAVVAGGSDWPTLAGRWPGTIQVHGEECPQRLAESGATVIRGIKWSAEAVQAWDAHPSVAALLIDGPAGGSGRGFDHQELARCMRGLTKPVIVAGGLRSESVAAVIALLGPYGVDVSSGVERSPGVKDAAAIRRFCKAVLAI